MHNSAVFTFEQQSKLGQKANYREISKPRTFETIINEKKERQDGVSILHSKLSKRSNTIQLYVVRVHETNVSNLSRRERENLCNFATFPLRMSCVSLCHPLRMCLYPAILTTEQYRGTVIETGYASTGLAVSCNGHDLMEREIVIIETDG